VPDHRAFVANVCSEPGVSQQISERDELATQQAKLLEAKATLDLRDGVVQNVLAVQPTLNAVHHATHASPVDRYRRIDPCRLAAFEL
jgi:hypothetical protein